MRDGILTAATAVTPQRGGRREAPEPISLGEAERMAERGDRLYIIGCLICGTWVFGPLGGAILLYGLHLMRKAKAAGAEIRPWSITLIGGFILVDTTVNMVAWGFDLFPAHDTIIGRSLWVDYGRLVDGGYILFHNSTAIGGVADHGEKSVQIGMVLLAMPIKLAASFGFLRMKRWGLQWMIIAYWMYMTCWMIYLPNMLMDFPLRFGASAWGFPGFWLLVNLPFLGPLVLLPYLHTLPSEDFAP